MPEEFKRRFQQLANLCMQQTSHHIVVEDVPPSRYIVAPILSAREVREQSWKRGGLPTSRQGTLAGLNLVGWLQDNEFDYAPVCDKDFGILLEKVKQLGELGA